MLTSLALVLEDAVEPVEEGLLGVAVHAERRKHDGREEVPESCTISSFTIFQQIIALVRFFLG